MGQEKPEALPPQNPVSAVRLIFEYEGDQVKLISQIPVEMVVNSLDTARAEYSSFYVDSRDIAGKTLARVKAHSAFGGSTEVFPERPGEPITRVNQSVKKGAFTVVVPTPSNTSQVTIMKTDRISAGQETANAKFQSTRAANVESTVVAEVKEVASFPLINPIQQKGGQK